jgi:hypothetical protein
MLAVGAFGYPADYLFCWILFLSLLIHAWCFFRGFPKERFPKLGLLLGNGLVFLCMLAAVGLIAETHLRFLAVETDAFGLSLPARRWFALHTRLNALGCRDEEWPVHKPPGTYRIAFVGDSFTYGWGVEREEERFTELVQDRLNPSRAREEADGVRDEGTKVRRDEGEGSRDQGIEASRIANWESAIGNFEVFNVAKPGWGTGDQIEPIASMIDVYGVDEVVLCYVPNDIEKLIPVRDGFNPVRPPMPALFNPDSSCLLDHLYWHCYVPRVATVADYFDWLAEGFADVRIWHEHQRQFGAIIDLCRTRGVSLRVVLLPFLRTTGDKYQPARLHDTLRGFFAANDVPVVDLLAALSGIDRASLVVNANDAHPNQRAHALFAEAIWQAFYRAR